MVFPTTMSYNIVLLRARRCLGAGRGAIRLVRQGQVGLLVADL